MVEYRRFAPPDVRTGIIGGLDRGHEDAKLHQPSDGMKIICSWCRREGKSGYLGEREPLDDPTQTDSICARHRDQVLEALPSVSFPDVDMLVVIQRREVALHGYLQRTLAGLRGVKLIIERRRRERRREQRSVSEDRRREGRRLRRGVELPGCTVVRFRRTA